MKWIEEFYSDRNAAYQFIKDKIYKKTGIQIINSNVDTMYESFDFKINAIEKINKNKFKELSNYSDVDSLYPTEIFGVVVRRDNFYLKDVPYDKINAEFPRDERNCIFLSYAYEDKLLALYLFFKFYDANAYLYVDFMHNPKMDDEVDILKQILLSTISACDQFLFLRTTFSEFFHKNKIRSRFVITSWCAWEIGAAFEHLENKKFYCATKDIPDNKILNNFKKFNKVDASGRMSE